MSDEIRAVVFDFDGVLVNSVELKNDAMVQAFSNFGDDFAESVLAYHKKHGTNRYETAAYVQEELGIEDPDFVNTYAQKYSDIVEEQIVKMPFYHGADSLIIELAKTMPVFISTGTPEKEIIQILRRKCSMHLFTDVYGSPDKKEEHFSKIFDQTKLSPNNILFIGDMPSDYMVAKNVGVNFLGYNFYNHHLYPEVENIEKILEVREYIYKRKQKSRRW